MVFLEAVSQEVLFFMGVVVFITIFIGLLFVNWFKEASGNKTWKQYRIRFIRFIDDPTDPTHRELLTPVSPGKVIMVIPLVSCHRFPVVEASWDFYHDFAHLLTPRVALYGYLKYLNMRTRFNFPGITFHHYKG